MTGTSDQQSAVFPLWCGEALLSKVGKNQPRESRKGDDDGEKGRRNKKLGSISSKATHRIASHGGIDWGKTVTAIPQFCTPENGVAARASGGGGRLAGKRGSKSPGWCEITVGADCCRGRWRALSGDPVCGLRMHISCRQQNHKMQTF